jgi:hypothetical protein
MKKRNLDEKGELKDYSFCEPVSATGRSRWHIRKLTAVGPKYSGGIDTPSLCGYVQPTRGWDIKTEINDHHLKHACPQCASQYVMQWNYEHVKALEEQHG